MTIFAYDGNTLVSDCAEYKYGIMVNDKVVKPRIVRHGDLEVAVTGAGSTGWLKAFQDWVEKEVRTYTGKLNVNDFKVQDVEGYNAVFAGEESFDNIVVFQRGNHHQAYYLGQRPFPIKVYAPYAGGHQDAVLVAMGAMHAGADARRAVGIAVKLTGIAHVGSDLTEVKFA